MNETKIKGLTTELACQLYFTQLGYNVSVPLGEDCRYDMIVDFGNKLKRIQVKYCHENKNKTGIQFSTVSTRSNSNEVIQRKYTNDEVDYYATFYNGKCYLIKVIENPVSCITLNFSRNRKRNQQDIMFIDDYECEKQIELIKNDIESNEKHYIICQYTKDLKLINTFASVHEAARMLGDVNKNGHISNAINGKYKTAYGYIWKRELANN